MNVINLYNAMANENAIVFLMRQHIYEINNNQSQFETIYDIHVSSSSSSSSWSIRQNVFQYVFSMWCTLMQCQTALTFTKSFFFFMLNNI